MKTINLRLYASLEGMLDFKSMSSQVHILVLLKILQGCPIGAVAYGGDN